ncbi:MAG: transaldolase [Alphaproteobacteria bacterium]|nr:transaldolase [Alphaproteobacteria bacterium]
MKASDLKIKIFADGADLATMKEQAKNPLIKGFTTNPSLIKSAGITDYKAYALAVLDAIPNHPISFEVFADDLPTIEAQAREIATWAANVNVKIPVTNTKGESLAPLVKRLSTDGVVLNITALYTVGQVKEITDAVHADTPAILSVFAGRLGDTGHDPVPVMEESVGVVAAKPKAELLWASTREVFNVIQADRMGCHIITAPDSVISKLGGLGKDPMQNSLDTVKAFYADAQAAGFDIKTG